MRRFSFRPSQRIRRRGDFDKVYRAGRRLDAGEFLIHFHANECGCDRLGLSVARKRVGNAIRRNRAKRIIRELFRSCPDRITGKEDDAAGGKAVDMIVSPKPSMLTASSDRLRRSWRKALASIRTRLGG